MRFDEDTLYVTDLDGTLLGKDARIPQKAVEMLNEMLDSGLPFTVATARSWASAGPIVKPLHLTLPAVAFNGAFLVDPQSGAALDQCLFSAEQAQEIASVYFAHGLSPLVYAKVGGQEKVSWLRAMEYDGIRAYAAKRKGDPRLRPVEREDELFEGEIFYLSMLGSHEMLDPLEKIVRQLPFVHVSFTSDAYQPELNWLELSRTDATKAKGVEKLRRMTGKSRIVCFGDNLNDLPMFRVADECYAVANAREELKSTATGVIGSNGECGVPAFIRSRAKAD